MEFECDPARSATNKLKHGIDFFEAQALWQDIELVVAPLLTEDEPRFLAVGRIHAKHWAAIHTIRGKAVRIISVRRARKGEVLFYEGP